MSKNNTSVFAPGGKDFVLSMCILKALIRLYLFGSFLRLPVHPCKLNIKLGMFSKLLNTNCCHALKYYACFFNSDRYYSRK